MEAQVNGVIHKIRKENGYPVWMSRICIQIQKRRNIAAKETT